VPAAQNKFPIDLIDEAVARQIVGGNRPISKPTFYRMIAAGRLPRGVLVTPGSRRYSRHEIEAAICTLFAARGETVEREKTRERRTHRGAARC
jgi:predicted DNA-binding transcriptional regulator AlpA